MAMRSVLSLNVSLGLFGFAVSVYKATNDPSEGVAFRQIHGACGQPINVVKRCQTCGVDVSMADLVKGVPSDGGFVTFTDEEVKALRPEAAGTITILGYLPANALDSAYVDGSVWYLKPDGKDDTTFVTWREALKGRWAVGNVVLYGRERIVGIRAMENILLMQALRTHAEIRNCYDVPSYEKVGTTAKPEYLELMEQVMVQRTIAFDDVVLDSDAYTEAVKAMIAARLAGSPLPTYATTPPASSGADLMALLKATLEEKVA